MLNVNRETHGMRKADYAILADIIKRQRASAYQSAANARARTGAGESAEFHEGRASTLELVACCFSREASVNREAFLKACGIEP